VRIREFGELPAQTASDAELVVSELVANALLHAHLRPEDPIDVTIERDRDHLVIAVDDHGSFSGHPRGREGIGLRVLDALCDEWHAQSGLVRASLRVSQAREGASPAASAATAAATAGAAQTRAGGRRWLRHA